MSSGEVFGTELGQLKIFIGAAPGVGKTYMMLREAVSLLERGIDVVVGYVELHERPETAAQMAKLEVLPRKKIKFQSHVFEEVDLDAIVARDPDVVIIDELAHTNAPGSTFSKRYMDVEFLLEQKISVLTAVNVQHIEGISEEAEEITGMSVKETIPVALIKRANEVSVIDVTPETLRQRLRDGYIYPTDKVDLALENFFRKANLSGLRELALRVVAEDVEERLERSYSRNKIPGPVGAREVIMVCVGDYERAIKLMLRGHRMAMRLKADLHVLTIRNGDESLRSARERLQISRLQELADEYAAEMIVELRNDRKIGVVIADVAKRLNVTQIVIGQTVTKHAWEKIWADNPFRYLLTNLRYTDLRIVGWREMPNIASSAQGINAKAAVNPTLSKRRGRLIIYVGAAPGVGKTYKMLQDAHDWKRRGRDVVIGLIETHGRAETAEQIGDLEMIPKQRFDVEGHDYEELDVDAIVKRHPTYVIIDELAHSNVPGCAREKRYQDVLYVLERGINVVTAVNIQHLESLRDKVEHITGVKVRERIPDWFMKLADEVKLMDVTLETLQQRLLAGKIYAKDKIQRALDHFFQTANLAALRELALLEVADVVDQRIHKDHHGLEFERILVCVNHRPHSEKLIRRGWRLADRLNAELWVLVVLTEESGNSDSDKDLTKIRSLSEQFDARFLTRQAGDQNVGATIVKVAEELQVSQLVVGQPLIGKGMLARMKTNPIEYVLENAEFVDLHIVGYERN